MSTFIYWSFALALGPFVLDLLIRTTVALGNWFTFHQHSHTAAVSAICLKPPGNLRENRQPPMGQTIRRHR